MPPLRPMLAKTTTLEKALALLPDVQLGRVPQLLVDAGVVQARAGKGPGAHADWASSKRRHRRERVIWAASGAAMN